MQENEFKTTIFQIGRDNDARVVGVDTNLLEKNFYYASFKESKGSTIYLICNPYTMYLAFAKKVGYEGIEYLNLNWDLTNLSLNYIPLSLHDLTSSIDGVLDELDAEEIHQIAYWKPEKCADIIFNYWD